MSQETPRKVKSVKAKVLKPCNITAPSTFVPEAPSEKQLGKFTPAHYKLGDTIRAKAGDVVEVCENTLRNLSAKGLLAPA